jgi:tetratricopeptide (TPR) repeat protein
MLGDERYDLFRLYLANIEQYRMTKRAFGFALAVLGLIAVVYLVVFVKNYSGLWLVFFTLLLVYMVFGEFLVGGMAFGPPERIIKKAAKQKLKEPDSSDAGELAAAAAKFLCIGNFTMCREMLNKVFELKNVGVLRIMFANTVLADLYRTEGKPDKSIKILKSKVLRKKKGSSSYSMFIIGRAWLEKGDYQKAIEALEEAYYYVREGHPGIPDLFKSGFRNREIRNIYRDALQVFVPYYLGKAYYWAPGDNQETAAEHLNSAIVLCRNRHFRPLLKRDFTEKE